MAPPSDDDLMAYVERVALHFEEGGLPRIAGRVLAWLLVAEPPYASVTDLTQVLGISAGSASSMTRMLAATGLLHKVAIPGARHTYFQVSTDAFEAVFEHKLRQLGAFHPIARDGLALLADEPPERSERLVVLDALYAFYDREMPVLIERWRRDRDQLIAAARAAASEDA